MWLDLTFIIIAYNEEEAISATVGQLLEWLERHDYQAEVLLMDDGSTDATGRIADDLAARHESVRVFHHPENVGHMRNTGKGFELAGTTYCTIVPGDGQLDIDSYSRFLPLVGHFDMILGFPEDEGARGLRRALLSYLWRLYLLLLFNVSAGYLGGMKIVPAALARQMEPYADGFVGSYERILRLVLCGASYAQIPFRVRPRSHGRSKAVSWGKVLHGGIAILKAWWHLKGRGVFPPGNEREHLRDIYRRYRADMKAGSSSKGSRVK